MGQASTPNVTSETLLTSHQAGNLLQVNPSSINNWVKEGRLSAFRTPGGHRRIKAQDLVSFLSKHAMPIPATLQGAAQRRVLVVEANEAQRNATCDAFTASGRVDCCCVSTLMEGMLQMGLFRPHVLVLDGDASDTDSADVTRRLQGMPETAQVEVFLSSTHANGNVGNVKQLSKPVLAQSLLSELGLSL